MTVLESKMRRELTPEEKEAREKNLPHVKGCATCDSYRQKQIWGPNHFPSVYCESGGRPHCTCDTCF